MTRPVPPRFSALLLLPALPLALISAIGPARAADLPSFRAMPPLTVAPIYAEPGRGGGGVLVARVPLRPAPLRYDIYGYPVLAGVPSPLAAGGCPVALQPDFDPDGNFAGYAPLPMCR